MFDQHRRLHIKYVCFDHLCWKSTTAKNVFSSDIKENNDEVVPVKMTLEKRLHRLELLKL